MTVLLRFPFTPEQHFTLRAIDSNWVKQRGEELSKASGAPEPDTQAALEEAVETLHDRMGHNLDNSKDILLYAPSTESDPFLVAIPVNTLSRKIHPVTPEKPGVPVGRNPLWALTIQEQFENVIFEGDFIVTPTSLDKNDKGDYLDPVIQLMWNGFNLYHEKMTNYNKASYKPRFDKTLGTYVIAKITHPSGSAVFINTPFRHRLKADAMNEGARLATHHNSAFALFRCLDVILPPEGETK